MPSAKGKPTDPALRQQVKEKVQASSEGGAAGQWTGNKSMRMAKQYESQGGSYEAEADSKLQPTKGTPKKKSAKAKSGKTSAKKAINKSGTTSKKAPKKAPKKAKAKAKAKK